MRLVAVQSNYCVNAAVSYSCLSLMDKMDSVERCYWGYLFSPDARRSYSRDAMSRMTYRFATKFRLPEALLQKRLEDAVLKELKRGDVVWLWPPNRSSFCERVRSRGAVLVTERINTSARMARQRIGAAYANLGWPLPAGWLDDAAVREEVDTVLHSDAVFAPNGFVRESLLEIGYPDDRILPSSYGWCPVRLAPPVEPTRERDKRIRFLYVGAGSVRKGLPLLLQVWRDAGIDGELVIAGYIEDEVRQRCADLLNQRGVVLTGYVADIAPIYHSADVFVFPTHEEGGPQVTFEAAGCGLALLVSDMGAAGAFRAGQDAFVVDPYDHDSWVDHMRRLAQDGALLSRMKQAAATRAQEYTWAKVAGRRLAQLQQLVGAQG